MEPRSLERGNDLFDALVEIGLVILQWSHVHSNVETGFDLTYRWHKLNPSMEPRSLERGNKRKARQLLWAVPTFNGATFTRTWKPPYRAHL